MKGSPRFKSDTRYSHLGATLQSTFGPTKLTCTGVTIPAASTSSTWPVTKAVSPSTEASQNSVRFNSVISDIVRAILSALRLSVFSSRQAKGAPELTDTPWVVSHKLDCSVPKMSSEQKLMRRVAAETFNFPRRRYDHWHNRIASHINLFDI